MDSVPRTQADVLGLPLLEGLGAGDDSQVVLAGGEGGSVWRSGTMESLALVQSYNLPPASHQELAQQEAARILMDQCSQLVQERSQPVENLDQTSIISFKRPIFYEGLHHLYTSGQLKVGCGNSVMFLTAGSYSDITITSKDKKHRRSHSFVLAVRETNTPSFIIKFILGFKFVDEENI